MRTRSIVYVLALGIAGLLSTGKAAAIELQLENGWTDAPFSTSNAEAFLDNEIVHLKGAIANGTNSIVFTLPPGLRPTTVVYTTVDLCNAASGRLFISPDGVVQVQTEGAFSDAQCFTSLDGAKFARSAAGFTALTLLNGWSNAPFATSDAAAALIDGIVYLKGAVHLGTTAALFTLPIEMRPATNVFVPIGLCAAAKGRLFIQPSGTVSVYVTTSFADAQCFTSLDGASFAPSASGFSEFALVNGWTHAPFSTSNAAAALLDDGIVRFKGAIGSGTAAAAFTLPAEMRPTTDVYLPIDLCNAVKGRLFISPDGVVHVQAEGGAFSEAQCITSLDSASFVPEPAGHVALLAGLLWITRMQRSRAKRRQTGEDEARSTCD